MNSKENKKRKFIKNYRKTGKYIVYMIPSLFLFVLFGVYPNLTVFPYSLYDWSPIRSTKEFVGWQNFRMLFVVNQDQTLKLIINTIYYVVLLFIIQTILSLILALALEKNTKLNTFFRAYFFLPKVFSAAMIGLTWQFVYDPNLGIINNIMAKLGFDGFPGKYLFQGNFVSVLLVVIVHMYANMGYPIMYFLSGLSSIPGELKEAASIDGANAWQTFTHVTFPLLIPTLTRISLLTLTTGVMAADYIVLIGSAANGQADTLSSYIFEQTRNGTAYGMVSAFSVLLFFVLAIFSVIQFVGMKKVEDKVLG